METSALCSVGQPRRKKGGKRVDLFDRWKAQRALQAAGLGFLAVRSNICLWRKSRRKEKRKKKAPKVEGTYEMSAERKRGERQEKDRVSTRNNQHGTAWSNIRPACLCEQVRDFLQTRPEWTNGVVAASLLAVCLFYLASVSWPDIFIKVAAASDSFAYQLMWTWIKLSVKYVVSLTKWVVLNAYLTKYSASLNGIFPFIWSWVRFICSAEQ